MVKAPGRCQNNITNTLYDSSASPMTDLDTVWFEMLDGAATSAEKAGREAVADYLRLKASNDAIRKAGVKWLFETAIGIAGEAMRDRRNLTIEREEPYSFARGSSNMVGSRLEVRHGVRCLTLEAGWARTPSDGIMLKGALAFARISHFGIPSAGSEIRLVHVDSLPAWVTDEDANFDAGNLQQHLDLLVERAKML